MLTRSRTVNCFTRWTSASLRTQTYTWFYTLSISTNVSTNYLLSRRRFVSIFVRIREGHRTSGYSFVKLWRTKFMLLLRPEELWYHKSSLLRGKLWHRHFKVYGVLYEKMRFSTNNSKAQIPWKFHGTLMGVKMNS
jgi:hypothetical protein